jgi:uncharacterized protein YgbK (DUF1537 family)
MIAVIADDLTGAAEIGGIGLEHGLKVEISTKVDLASTADLLVINTDSRSKGEQEAICSVVAASRALKMLNPEFVFKKIDSVLRGHVLHEVEVEAKIWGRSRAVIIGGNPHLGRTLVNQMYFINGVAVNQTSFAGDPEFPIKSAHVKHMLKVQADEVTIAKHNETHPVSGVIVGEVETYQDLMSWADALMSTDYLAGSSSFFSALLQKKFPKGTHEEVAYEVVEPILYISGTTFSANSNKIRNLHNMGGPVIYMPISIANGYAVTTAEIIDWTAKVVELLAQHSKAIIAIDQDHNYTLNAMRLRTNMALATRKIMEKTSVSELVIEGGSTAAAVFAELNISTLVPVQQFGAGIIRSRARYHQNIHVTLKPGSYPWSEEIWSF